MAKLARWVAGLLLAFALSQFPEFSQQYLQRLAGAVDELSSVVEDFDLAASRVGITREQALNSLSEDEFNQLRQKDMAAIIARQARLIEDLQVLRSTPMAFRALQPWRFTDPKIATATIADFNPAMPVTLTGIAFALIGFAIGYFAAWLATAGLARRGGARANRRGRAAIVRTPPPPLSQTVVARARPALPIGWLTRTNDDPHKVVQQGEISQIAVLSARPGMNFAGQVSMAGDLVLIVTSGRASLMSDGMKRMIEEDQLAMIAPGSTYEIHNHGTEVLQMVAIEPRGAAITSGDRTGTQSA